MSDYYEVKINLGQDWHGKTIRKSFYSKKSKADARRKVEKYRAQYEFNLLCGGDEARRRVFSGTGLFSAWSPPRSPL